MKEKARQLKVFELGFTIMEKLVLAKDYENKEELSMTIKTAVNIANDDNSVSEIIKDGYQQAMRKIDALSWDDVLEIKEIMSN